MKMMKMMKNWRKLRKNMKAFEMGKVSIELNKAVGSYIEKADRSLKVMETEFEKLKLDVKHFKELKEAFRYLENVYEKNRIEVKDCENSW